MTLYRRVVRLLRPSNLHAGGFDASHPEEPRVVRAVCPGTVRGRTV